MYIMNPAIKIECGFTVHHRQIHNSALMTKETLLRLPFHLFKSVDYKTTSSIIGSLFCEELAKNCNAFVNPIEKGHPDIIPVDGSNCTEQLLRNYPQGLEVKCTVGNIRKGANLRAGQNRLGELIAITWQAHHREVRELIGLVWDFIDVGDPERYPMITGIFHSNALNDNDWGAISGTSGRNTKVTGMLTSGKYKMGQGWILLLNRKEYINKYSELLQFTPPEPEPEPLMRDRRDPAAEAVL